MNGTIKTHLIFGRYRLIQKIDEGSFGKVFLGYNEQTNEKVAIKLEPTSNKVQILKSEAFYLFMLKSVGIPKLKAFGKNKKYNILIETLLGDSLEKILKRYKKNLPLKDSLMIAIQVIERLEYLHSKYLIHRDIKPGNFLIGYNDPYIIYLIDFGICKKYRSSRTGNHIKFSIPRTYNGTSTYASLNAMKGYEVSRRDDLESAAYLIINLIKGYLPWELVKGKTKYERYKKIYDIKLSYTAEELCKDLPKEIKEFLAYSRNLEFEQDPNYKYCYSLFNNALIKNGFNNDLMFSWIKNPEIIDKLKHKKNIITQNIFTKRKTSPQTRIMNSLMNSSEKPKSRQSTNFPYNLNISTESQFQINTNKLSKIHTANNSKENTLKESNPLISNENIKTKIPLKNYRRICLKKIINTNKDFHKNIISNTLPNISQSNKNSYKKKENIKKFIKIPSSKKNSLELSMNKQNEIPISINIKNKSRNNDIRKKLTNNLLYSNNNINNNANYNYGNNINSSRRKSINIADTLVTPSGTKKENYIKIINNNIINSDINMLININKNKYPSKNENISYNQTENKNLQKILKPNIKVNLNNLYIKRQILKLKYKRMMKNKVVLTNTNNNNYFKINDIAYKTFNNFSLNNGRNNSRNINMSEKKSINSFNRIENKYKKFIREKYRYSLSNNTYKISGIYKSKSIESDIDNYPKRNELQNHKFTKKRQTHNNSISLNKLIDSNLVSNSNSLMNQNINRNNKVIKKNYNYNYNFTNTVSNLRPVINLNKNFNQLRKLKMLINKM